MDLITGARLLAWIKFDPSMEKWLYALWNVGWNYQCIPKIQRLCRSRFGMDKQFPPVLYWASDLLSLLGLKLNFVRKSGPTQSYSRRIINWLTASISIDCINVLLCDKLISTKLQYHKSNSSITTWLHSTSIKCRAMTWFHCGLLMPCGGEIGGSNYYLNH